MIKKTLFHVIMTIWIVISAEIGVRMENNRMVDPRCVNASNPYHVCAEYCFQKMKEMKQTEGGKAGVLLT